MGTLSKEAQSAAQALLKLISSRNFGEEHKLRDGIFRLAKEFEQAHGRPPAREELSRELENRLSQNGTIRFFYNKIAPPEKTYADIHRLHCNGEPNAEKLEFHANVSGDLTPLEIWLEDKAAPDDLAARLSTAIQNGHLEITARLVDCIAHRHGRDYLGLILEKCRPDVERHPICLLAMGKGIGQGSASARAESEFYAAFAARFSVPPKYLNGLIGYVDDFKSDQLPPSYMRIRNFLSYETENAVTLNTKAFVLSLVFPDYRDFTTYCERWPHFVMQRLEMAQSFDFKDFYLDEEADYAQWGKAALHYGPQIFFYLRYQEYARIWPTHKNGQLDLKDLKSHIFPQLPAEGLDDELEDLRKFCFENQLVEEEFEAAAYLMKKYGGERTSNLNFPTPSVSGEKFGLPGYQLKPLPFDDFRFFFLGKYTGCCERLLYYCANSIVHAYKTRKSTFYVLTDPADRIIAHSYVWRSKGGHLVFDGFEAQQKDARVSNASIRIALHGLADALEQQNGEFLKSIVLGQSGKTLAPHIGLKRIDLGPEPVSFASIIDSEDGDRLEITSDHIGYSSLFYSFRQLKPAVRIAKPIQRFLNRL